MGEGLILAASFDLGFVWNLLQVVLGLGAVIFVHELGHFAVAKMCGVKCEKFYLGFDIYGLRLFRFRWGETEYGIGILPLGGYVKMLGQDDNPGKAAEERQRSTLASDGATPAAAPSNEKTTAAADEKTASDAEPAAPLDPRSYLAQSVPERMAIISAGVIMNVIFALVVTSAVYRYGIMESPAVIGSVLPGELAWKEGLRPGDEVIRINDIHDPWFDDIQRSVVLGNSEEGVEFEIRRQGVEDPFTIRLHPERKGLAQRIGVTASATNRLGRRIAMFPWSAAEPGAFQPGDRLTAVDGQPLDGSPLPLETALVRNPEQTLALTLERQILDKEGKVEGTKTLDVPLPPLPVMQPGFSLTMEAISGVRRDSPAAAAGLKVGDEIIAIDGAPPVDAMFLGEWLRRRAGQALVFAVRRDGKELELTVTPEQPVTDEPTLIEDGPQSAPAIGIVYHVNGKVAAVERGPVQGELAPGSVIKKVRRLLPQDASEECKHPIFDAKGFELLANKRNFPGAFIVMQNSPPGTQLELTLEQGEPVVVALQPASDWFQYERGLGLAGLQRLRKGEDWPSAIRLGARQTKKYLLQVYGFLRKLVSGGISTKGLSGIIGITTMAVSVADTGIPELLMFLCMLSANLAVVNFLPIPVLDGGHMVFLTYEAIFRKPPSERVIVALSYLGLSIILGLFVWTLLLDTGLIARK